MADENKQQARQFRQHQAGAEDQKEEGSEQRDEGSKQSDEGGKGHLLRKHYEQNHPHEEVPEVLATSTVTEGFYVVTLQGPHGPYHAILIRDKNGSTLIGKQ